MSVLGKCKLCLSASPSLFCCPGVRTLPWEIKHRSVVLGLKCHLSGIRPLPKMTECCVHSRLGCPHATVVHDSLGSEVPAQAQCDSSPRPWPVLLGAAGDRQGQQNLSELQGPLRGLWGDSEDVCHGPEINDLDSLPGIKCSSFCRC